MYEELMNKELIVISRQWGRHAYVAAIHEDLGVTIKTYAGENIFCINLPRELAKYDNKIVRESFDWAVEQIRNGALDIMEDPFVKAGLTSIIGTGEIYCAFE